MRSATAIKRKYGANAFRKWGARGGSPILQAWKKKKLVMGYKVSKQ